MLVRSLGWEDTHEIFHASILAWEIPRTEEPGGLQSMGLQGVGPDSATEYTRLSQSSGSSCSSI